MKKDLKLIAAKKSDKELVKMYVEIYNKYFFEHDLYHRFDPNGFDVYVVKSNTMKKNDLWKVRYYYDFAIIVFNDKLTDDEIKKGMVNIFASLVSDATRWNDRYKMRVIESVAAKMGTTKDDIMSVRKIKLSERK